MLASAAANFTMASTFLRQMPDYLVLAFFGVTVYFRERLAFIDLLVKPVRAFRRTLVGNTAAKATVCET